MKKIFLIVFLLSSCWLFSCSQAPTTPTHTDAVAWGGVELFDSVGNAILDASGVRVSVERASQFTVTDSKGRFTIEGLPEGQISLIFSKEGFAEVHNLIQSKTGTQAGSYPVYPLFAISHLIPNIVLRPFEGCYVRFNFKDSLIFSCEAGGYLIHQWFYDSA